jgi:hypothetical protein
MAFRAPIAEVAFTLERIAGLDAAIAAGALGDLTSETVIAILDEAGRFAANDLVAIDAPGDRAGVRFADGKVAAAPGFKDAYHRWRAAGWNGMSAPEKFGGQGLPIALHVAVQEFWNAGCASFATGPMLTGGAIDTLVAHASPELQARYLPKLVSGEWMATMNLTEPDAGSDLGAIRTRAEEAGDGTYRLFGEKIFITYGDHDITDNIIHLVLARLTGAPAGTAGLSLFLVPKFLPAESGNLGAANDLAPARIEEKLGLHASPTCAMVYGGAGKGATGWLVGEEDRGLAAMFTMMNLARLTVGIQGIGVAERAYQEALAYARQRRQGRAAGNGGMVPIVEHPDVQAMLATMKALVAASRAIAYACAFAIDMSRRGPEDERRRWADRASLLTPLAKAFSTDAAIEVANLGIQVHGGIGYMEATGAAQRYRDARIFAIYEGTNGIQAIDLMTRKLKLADGAAVELLIAEIADIAADARRSNRPELGQTGARLEAAIADLRAATTFLLAALADRRQRAALAGATAYLRLFALATGGALLARGALKANGADGQFVALARFFAERILGETAGLRLAVGEGAGALDQAATALFSTAGAGGL